MSSHRIMNLSYRKAGSGRRLASSCSAKAFRKPSKETHVKYIAVVDPQADEIIGNPKHYAPFKTDKATSNHGLHMPVSHCEFRRILRSHTCCTRRSASSTRILTGVSKVSDHYCTILKWFSFSLFILIHSLKVSQCWIRIFTVFPAQDSHVRWVWSAYPLYHMQIITVISGPPKMENRCNMGPQDH